MIENDKLNLKGWFWFMKEGLGEINSNLFNFE